MHLSPDQLVIWRIGPIALNATVVFTWFVMAVLVALAWLATRRITPDAQMSRWQNLLEVIVAGIRSQIREVAGHDPAPYIPFVGTLFLFIAASNLLAVVPGYEPPTGSLSTTAALALCVFVAVPVYGIGKIHDIFAGRDIDRSIHTEGNHDGMERTTALLAELERGFVFTNLVDFDMRFGHRRNPQGYARALQQLDADLPPLLDKMQERDLLLICADHGCDPTFTAHTDHTREYVPLLLWSPRWSHGAGLGIRSTFADLGATVAAALGTAWPGPGRSFLPAV